MQIGRIRSEALRGLGARTSVQDLKSFVSAMVQADAVGIPIAQVLRVQSSEMRTRRRQRAEEKADKAPVKIMIPVNDGKSGGEGQRVSVSVELVGLRMNIKKNILK